MYSCKLFIGIIVWFGVRCWKLLILLMYGWYMEGGRREKYNLKFKMRYLVCFILLYEILFWGVILIGKYSDLFRLVDLFLFIM